MALIIGSAEADSGMSKAIFDEIDKQLSPSFQNAEETLDEARKGWRKLAFAVAQGVVNHIISQSEVKGVEIRINDVVHEQTNTVRVA